jgi:hypothetical protein
MIAETVDAPAPPATIPAEATTDGLDPAALAAWEEALSSHSLPPSEIALPALPDGPALALAVPYRTQFDGTTYASSNCGPTSLAMVLEAYGLKLPTSRLRAMVGELQPPEWGDGVALDSLAVIAQRHGLVPVGLYRRGGGGPFSNYKRWTLAEVRQQLLAGRPVITLARYAELPGNAAIRSNSDHWIVLTGVWGSNFIYNDPAPNGGLPGYGRLMSEAMLLHVWSTSSIPRHAAAFVPVDGRELPTVHVEGDEAVRAALQQLAARHGDRLDLGLPPEPTEPPIDLVLLADAPAAGGTARPAADGWWGEPRPSGPTVSSATAGTVFGPFLDDRGLAALATAPADPALRGEPGADQVERLAGSRPRLTASIQPPESTSTGPPDAGAALADSAQPVEPAGAAGAAPGDAGSPRPRPLLWLWLDRTLALLARLGAGLAGLPASG